LRFKEAFSQEKAVYEKTKVGGWNGQWLLVFFVFVFLIQFLILQVYNDFVEKMHFDIVGGIGVVFDGVAWGSPIRWVPDFSIAITFGRPPFDILLGAPFFS
jgi:hypothetical protein